MFDHPVALLGRIALLGALLSCGLAAWASVAAARRARTGAGDRSGGSGDRLVETGGRLLAAAAGLVALATAALLWALLTGDFSLAYVARATSRSMTWPYRAGALWGGMEGSLLLWCLLLAGGSAVWARRLRRAFPDLGPALPDRRGPAQAVLAAVTGGALVLPLALADPFAALRLPALDGGGLTPILEHPAMLYHPPILYLGQTALAVPFALTVAALLARRLDGAWLQATRGAALVAWVALSAGMAAGAHWAYQELGWGGFWAWDPVENSSLLPWLCLTAFLHAGLLAEGRAERGDGVRLWTAALALAAFAFGLLGVYLTRSGATGSVHAFAEARAVGVALLVAVGLVVAAGALVLVRAGRPSRVPSQASSRGPGRSTSRRSGRRAVLLANNGLLVAALCVVAAGTLYPLVSEAFGGADSRPRSRPNWLDGRRRRSVPDFLSQSVQSDQSDPVANQPSICRSWW